ncbi:MAG: phospholipid-binding protein MlaC [Geminicoccaceae bacterium]|jgi:phospholipid transport system substrate-binding protein
MVAHWRRRALMVGFSLLMVVPWLGSPAVAAEISPEHFVADLAAEVIAVLKNPAASERVRLDRVDALTAGAFDLERTARVALGRFWKSASEAERREFAGLFKAYVLTSYGRRFRLFADRSFTVMGARPAQDGVLVESRVDGGATPIRLDWRLTATPTSWRVLDISVEGVSLLFTFRNEFAAVIERSGGQLAGLIDELRNRVAAEQAQLAG